MARERTPLKRSETPPPEEPKVNILLVDDRPENLVALESVLVELGQNLVSAGSGRDALKHLLHTDFAVILLDVQMPIMDGFETAALIRSRARSQHTPIVFLTAINKTDEAVTRGYSLGAVDYVFKPFQPEILKAKVSAFVELSKKRKQLEIEVAQRMQAEEEVRQLNADLERRVAARTAELRAVNQSLEQEIAERRRAEEERTRLYELEQQARREAETAQQRLAFLGEASAILSGSLDYQITMERVAQLAVPYLADFCIVDLVGEEGQIRRMATAHIHAETNRLLQEKVRRYAPDWSSPQPASRVLRSGKSEVTARVDAEWLQRSTRDAEHMALFRALDVRSYMVVPLVARGYTIGVMSFGLTGAEAEEGRRYTAADLVLAEDLARRAAAAIDNAHLFREVQEAGRRKDEFLAMLAHELRNPLAAIANADYILDELVTHDDQARHFRTIIGRQTRHLSRLVDDLLDISRITRGKIELRKERMDLTTAVQRAIETSRPLIEAREHTLHVSLPEFPIWLNADPTRIEQVTANLLNNAAKYTEPGGQIQLSLEIGDQEISDFGLRIAAPRAGGEDLGEPSGCDPLARSRPELNPQTLPPARGGAILNPQSHGSPLALIRVRDTGIGISPELLPCVFELFTQAERSLDRSQGGLGIGLALVQNLIELHGGTVSAHSEGPGQGSEFRVRLPIAGVGREFAAPEAAGPEPAAGAAHSPFREAVRREFPPRSGTQRVLVVEDNADAAETLTEMLELWGCEVRVAPNGVVALELAPNYQPEVVLLDIGLPGMDGYEVARRLRELDPRAGRGGAGWDPEQMMLVVISGYGQEENRRRSREAGVDIHLTKPVDPHALRKLLHSQREAAHS